MRIEDVRVILTAPAGIDLVVVKVETSEPGLYGLGCGTFTQRSLAVKTTVEEYLRPFLLGKDPANIEDIWRSSMYSAYWRGGPVLNNAVSGVDMALWDIKAKRAGMPLYDLLGGKCREGVPVYRHASGRDPQEVEDAARRLVEEGDQYVRCQMGFYGGEVRAARSPEGAPAGAYYDPNVYAHNVVELFDHLRSTLGREVGLCHDIHERLTPIEAVNLAKRLEAHELFFLEDPLPPESLEWFRTIRSQCATPLAMGELFTVANQWNPLIAERLIDFIRVHVSAIGGVTPAWKLAHLAGAFGVRTAWHGPGDVSPVGHAANVHLDLSLPNFGVQEWTDISPELQEVFPGCPELRNGYVYANDRPGLGIDIDEAAAARFPCSNRLPSWTLARRPDGTSFSP